MLNKDHNPEGKWTAPLPPYRSSEIRPRGWPERNFEFHNYTPVAGRDSTPYYMPTPTLTFHIYQQNYHRSIARSSLGNTMESSPILTKVNKQYRVLVRSIAIIATNILNSNDTVCHCWVGKKSTCSPLPSSYSTCTVE
jgi:hypothetical protein